MAALILALAGAITTAMVVAPAAWAVEPDEILADAVLEQRAREISKTLRCVVCRNQSIDDSRAGIARTMRIVVRERLVAGDTNDEAVAFLVHRYGDFILLRPPMRLATWALWAGPFLFLGIAVIGFRRLWRSRSAAPEPQPISEADRDLLKKTLYMNEAD